MPFGFLLMGKDFLSLFLSSLVTVMYYLESYEGLALHLFKEFRDGEFRGLEANKLFKRKLQNSESMKLYASSNE